MKKKNIKITNLIFGLSLLTCFSVIKPMEEASKKKEPGIKDESQISDKEKGKIAILGYGSLVRAPRALKIRAPFVKTDFTLPIGLTRFSKYRKGLTLVVDSEQDVQRPIWYALSQYEYLPNALMDVAAREGIDPDPATGLRKLRNIYFMTNLPGRIPKLFASEDERKIGYGDWVIKEEKEPKAGAPISRKRLTDDQAKSIAKWADENGFIAVIWASFDPNMSKNDALEMIKTREDIKTATKNYLKESNPQTVTAEERQILDLKEKEHFT